MISYEVARSLVEEKLSKMRAYASESEKLIIDDSLTIEKEFGWVFFYNTKAYLESRDEDYMMFGNAPIIVDKEDGSLHFTGTGRSIDEYISEFLEERKRKK